MLQWRPCPWCSKNSIANVSYIFKICFFFLPSVNKGQLRHLEEFLQSSCLSVILFLQSGHSLAFRPNLIVRDWKKPREKRTGSKIEENLFFSRLIPAHQLIVNMCQNISVQLAHWGGCGGSFWVPQLNFHPTPLLLRMKYEFLLKFRQS